MFKERFKEIVARFSDEGENTSTTEKKAASYTAKTPKPQKTASKAKKNNEDKGKRKEDEEKLFLWKATKGDDTVWLLGTIHVAKKNFYPLPKEILKAFSRSNHLLVEVDITDPQIVKEMRASRKKVSGFL